MLPTHNQLLSEFRRAFALGRAESTVRLRFYYLTRLRDWAESKNRHLLDLGSAARIGDSS